MSDWTPPPGHPGYACPLPAEIVAGVSPGRSRRRTLAWLGLGGGAVILAVALALSLVLVVFANKASAQSWRLVAVSDAGGLHRNNDPGVSAALGASIGSVKAQFDQMPRVGRIRSTVDGVYDLGHTALGATPKIVVFVGLNGSFNERAVLHGMTAGGRQLPRVAAGAHGGTAEGGADGVGSQVCFWVTGSTIGFLVIQPNGAEATRSLDGLMIRMRDSVEAPAGR